MTQGWRDERIRRHWEKDIVKHENRTLSNKRCVGRVEQAVEIDLDKTEFRFAEKRLVLFLILRYICVLFCEEVYLYVLA